MTDVTGHPRTAQGDAVPQRFRLHRRRSLCDGDAGRRRHGRLGRLRAGSNLDRRFGSWRSSTCTAPSLAPGFVDSHVHLTETGIALDSLQLGGVRSARELLDAVAGFSASASGAGGRAGPWLGRDAVGGPRPALPRKNSNAPPAGGPSTSPASMCTRRSSRPRWRRPPASTGWTAPAPAARSSAAAHTAARLAARRLPAAALRGYQQQALAEAAANGYVALAEMAAPHIGSIEDLQLAAGWNAGPDAVPEILPYWGELADSAGACPVHPRRTGRAGARAGRGPEH